MNGEDTIPKPRATKITKGTKASQGALLEDEPAKAFDETQNVEVHEQPNTASTHSQGRQNLRLVNRSKLPNRLDFDDNDALDDEVQSMATHQFTSITNFEGFLAVEPQSSTFEFHAQRPFVNTLDEPRPQFPMNVDARNDDLPHDLFSLCADWFAKAFSRELKILGKKFKSDPQFRWGLVCWPS